MRRRFRQLTPSVCYGPHPTRWGVAGGVSVAAFLSLLGCAAPVEPPPPHTQKAQAVVGGTLSERESVVFVRAIGPNGNSLCSGTLVAPNLVLTARHCVSAFTNGNYSCTIDGYLDLDRSRSPANAGDMGLTYPPENIGIHIGTVPDFYVPTVVGRAIFAPETDTICRNDIAFVLLEEELDLEYSTIRLDEGLSIGEKTTTVGFGTNDNRRTERTERGDLPVEAIGFSDFYPVEGNALPRTFVLGTSVCPGDSGGPAFSDETGEVLGVFSFFRGGDCESSEARNFFTQAAPFRQIALAAFEAAGYLELIEPEEPPPVEDPPPTEDPPPVEAGGAPGDDEEESQRAPEKKGGCAHRPGAPVPLKTWPFVFLVLAFTYRRRQRRAARVRN